MTLAPGTEQLLQLFIILAGMLLIPVVVGLVVVMFKLAFLIHSVSDFVKFATYELTPLIKEVRLLAEHVEDIGHRAANGVEEISNTLSQAGPVIKKGISQAKTGVSAIVSGIGRSFCR